MKETVEGGICSNCGFKNEAYSVPASCLDPMTPLHGKYILGKTTEIDPAGITYTALDLQSQAAVSVKELYDEEICTRKENHFAAVSPEHQMVFEEKKKHFLEEARARSMSSGKDPESGVSVTDYFEENDTVYLVMGNPEGKSPEQKKGTKKQISKKMIAGVIIAVVVVIAAAAMLLHNPSEKQPAGSAAQTSVSSAESDTFRSLGEGYQERDLVEDLEGVYIVSSALDGQTSMCINRDKKYHKEPTVVVFKSEWLTTEDTLFQFEFVPTGSESRYKIFPVDQKNGEHKCLQYNTKTKELEMKSESKNKNQLFRIIYVDSTTFLLQTYNESVVGMNVDRKGQADGMAVLSRPYDEVKDSRMESWLLQIPRSDEE